MLAALFYTCDQPQQFVLVHTCSRNYGSHARFPFRQGSGFVDYQRVHFFQNLQSLGIFDQHAGVSSASGAHHNRDRGSQSQCTRTRNDQHRYGIHQGVRQTRLGPE